MNWLIVSAIIGILAGIIVWCNINNRREQKRMDKIREEKERLNNLNTQQYYRGR